MHIFKIYGAYKFENPKNNNQPIMKIIMLKPNKLYTNK